MHALRGHQRQAGLDAQQEAEGPRVGGVDADLGQRGVDLGLYPIVTLEKQLPNMIGNLV